jgi:hypothetical protein
VLAFFIAFSLFHEHNFGEGSPGLSKDVPGFSFGSLLVFVPALSPVRIVVVWWRRVPKDDRDYKQDEKKYHVFDVHFKIGRKIFKFDSYEYTHVPRTR